MRKDKNPNKDKEIVTSFFSHQIILPVHIPNHEGYFLDVFKILQLCVESLLKTTHSRTFITVVDNGCCTDVRDYLKNLLHLGNIHELIITEHVGKLNAIIKGLAGHNFPLITISDADVLFLENWQAETIKIFNYFPRSGVVGLIPQFLTYQSYCQNILFENFWNKNLSFVPVKNPDSIAKFYKSIGWKSDYPKARLHFTLGMKSFEQKIALVGSGHAVATYRRELFKQDIPLYNSFKMGGGSENILDELSLKVGLYRFTTYNNHAYHMGNIYEKWMGEEVVNLKKINKEIPLDNFRMPKRKSKIRSHFMRFIIQKLLKSHKLRMLFLRHKNLPKELRKSF